MGHEMVAGLGFLRYRIEERDFEVFPHDFQRNSRKTAAGSDVEHSSGRFFEPQKGKGVREMLLYDPFPVADGRKVGMGVIFEKKIGEPFEKRRLFGRRFDAETGKCFGNHVHGMETEIGSRLFQYGFYDSGVMGNHLRFLFRSEIRRDAIVVNGIFDPVDDDLESVAGFLKRICVSDGRIKSLLELRTGRLIEPQRKHEAENRSRDGEYERLGEREFGFSRYRDVGRDKESRKRKRQAVERCGEHFDDEREHRDGKPAVKQFGHENGKLSAT